MFLESFIMSKYMLVLLQVLIIFATASVMNHLNQTNRIETITQNNLPCLRELARWESRIDAPTSAVFSHDSSMLALSLNDNLVEILDPLTLVNIRTLQVAEIYGGRLQFSPDDSTLLLYRPNGAYMVWDVHTGEQIAHVVNPPMQGVFEVSAELTTYVVRI
jgi:WD40 repeat protein